MKNIFLLLIAFSFVFVACDDDEDIKVELAQGKYYLEDDPSDYVKHYIYEFYQKYGTVILTNPEPEDYVYNFSDSNPLEMVPPAQEESVLKAGLEMIDELFLSHYDDDFKKNHLPFTIQLADTIKRITNKTYYHDYYISRNFIALANVDSDISTMTDEKKDEISKGMHFEYWFNFLMGDREAFGIPLSFFNYGEDYYGEDIDPDREVSSKEELLERARTKGFISYPGYYTSSSYRYKSYDSKGDDLRDFFYHMIYLNRAEFGEILDTYPKIKDKYDLLRSAIYMQLNFDIATLTKEDI